MLRRTPLARGDSTLERRTPLRKRNPERLARLRVAQFDDTGEEGNYYDHITSLACLVTGRSPVDPAHVLGDRSTGAGPEGMAPLSREVHDDFDDGLLDDAHFQKRHGVSRADIRAWAVQHRAEWDAEHAEAVA
ncbi:MAG: hypothetical protein ABL993_02495 [Vicinamibacterales bacterium]